MPLVQLNKTYDPLAEAVRGYECLYNKAHRDFKDECQKNRAWIKIASDLVAAIICVYFIQSETFSGCLPFFQRKNNGTCSIIFFTEKNHVK